MRCLIVDDVKFFRLVIKEFIELDDALTLVAECDNAIEAHKRILNDQVDLIFLDIQMPGMNGLELAKILKNGYPLVIFTTCNSQYAVEAFELNAVDYLLKPVSLSRFIGAVDKAKKLLKPSIEILDHCSNEFVFIRDSNVVRKLSFRDILYFESTGDYVRIALGEKEYSIHSSLKSIWPKLPVNTFLRVHRSFIVNLNKIDSIEGKTLIIRKHLIPVSGAYRPELNKYMSFL
ncbi:LytTR family DNA-binding domain-containing protein [Pedobacter gandavensis]|uniref:LytR/AlgR family response regulator transcription factor n=1 Tax=Pedobacter gandavensis TaxID=2679963 RepID=UPI00292E9C2E|nr:LytTR family DNA-binding domain-containing protein [Pedobacter gandavensis]